MAVFVQLNLMVLSRSVASVVAQHLRFLFFFFQVARQHHHAGEQTVET